MTVVRIFGPPGTGKTSTLNRVVYHLIGMEDNSEFFDSYGFDLPIGGYKLNEIAYISFMNSAVDELLNRLGLTRNYRRGEWGTLHGLALHLLMTNKAIPREIVSNTFQRRGGINYWRRIFTYENGLAYDPNEEMRVLPGNQLFDGISYAINVYYPQYKSLGRVIDRLYDILPDPDLVPYAEEWVRFKAKHRIIDFDDILVLAYKTGVKPRSPVLLVDEFQDFGPLQYEIFKNWALGRDYVFVAGDDDQCITSEYSGASPKFIVELPEVGSDSDVVLRQSFRIAHTIHEASQLYITHYVKYRYPKEFLPRDQVGKVISLRMGYYLAPRLAHKFAMANKSVLLLARTNSLVREIEKMFWNEDIEYHRLKTRAVQIWGDFVNRMYEIIILVRNRRRVSETDLRFFFKFLKIPNNAVDTLVKSFAAGTVPLDAYKIFNNPLKVIDHGKVAEYLGSKEKADVALSALKAKLYGKMSIPPGKIYLDTIHAAKGREADIVILMDTVTPKILNGTYDSRESFEAEARVWYVAMTRAREALVIIPYDLPWLYPSLRKAGFDKVKVVSA